MRPWVTTPTSYIPVPFGPEGCFDTPLHPSAHKGFGGYRLNALVGDHRYVTLSLVHLLPTEGSSPRYALWRCTLSLTVSAVKALLHVSTEDDT